MKYTCIFSDMDGTLLNHNGNISDDNIKAINEFMRRGGYFTIATGRSEVITKPFLKKLKINFPAILFNGAAVYDFSREIFLHKKILSKDIVKKVYDIAVSVYPEICFEAFAEGPIRLFNRNGLSDHLVERENQPIIYKEYDAAEEYIKLLLYGKNEKLKEVASAIKHLAEDNFEFVFSAPFYLEILPLCCSKGTAMEWIKETYSIPTDSIAAIGDFDNDLTMLRQATLGAAPENAQENVKTAADVIVADCDHSALADLIHQYIL